MGNQNSSPAEKENSSRVSRLLISYRRFVTDIRTLNAICSHSFADPRTAHILRFEAITPLHHPNLLPILWRQENSIQVIVHKDKARIESPLIADTLITHKDEDPYDKEESDKKNNHLLLESRVLTIREFYYLYMFIKDNQAPLQDAITRLRRLQGKDTVPFQKARTPSPLPPLPIAKALNPKQSITSNSKSEEQKQEEKFANSSQPIPSPPLDQSREHQLIITTDTGESSSPQPPAFDSNDEDDDTRVCSICLAEDVDLALPCLHAFCKDCIEDWHEHDKSCPICRSTSDVAHDDVWLMTKDNEKDLLEQIQSVCSFPHTYLLTKPIHLNNKTERIIAK